MVNSPPRTSQNLTGLTSGRFPPFVTRPVIRVTRPLTGLTSHAFTDEYIIRFRPNPHDLSKNQPFQLISHASDRLGCTTASCASLYLVLSYCNILHAINADFKKCNHVKTVLY